MATTVGELDVALGLRDQLTPAMGAVNANAGGLIGRFKSLKVLGVAAFAGIAVGAGLLFAKMVGLGDQFKDAYNTIRVGTGATGDALNGLEADFRAAFADVPADMATVATATADLNTRLGLTGKPLQEMTKQFVEFARVAEVDVGEAVRFGTRLFGDWSIATENQAGAMDLVFRASQNSGIGVSELMETVVQFGAPLRNMGFGFEDSIAMMSKWEKEGVNTSTVLTGMKFALKTFARAGEDPQKALAKLIPKMRDMKDEQAAMTLGMETFGLRAGPDMVAAIREGRFEYADFADQLKNGSETILGAAKDTRTWRESLTILKNKALVGLEPLATAATNAMGWLAGGLLSLTENKAVLDFFGDIGAAIASVVAFVRKHWPTIEPYISAVFVKLGELARQAWAVIAPAMADIQTTVRSVVGFIRRNWPTIRTVFVTVGRALLAVVRVVWPIIKGVVIGAVNVIAGTIKLVMALIRGDWSAAWAAVKQILRGAWTAILAMLKGALKLVWLAIKAAWAVAKTVTAAGWRAIVSAAKSGAGALYGFVKSIPGRIVDALGSVANLLYEAGKAIIGGLIRGVTDKLGDLWDKVGSIGQRIKDLKGPLDYDRVMLKPAGEAIMGGLIGGITSQRAALDQALKAVTAQIASGARVPAFAGAGLSPVAASAMMPQSGLPVRRGEMLGAREDGGEHTHIHVHVPGGTTLIGEAESVGRILAPHVERAIKLKDAKRGRRR